MLVGAAFAQQGLLSWPIMVAVPAAWFVGAILFSGDIVLRALAGQRLFAMTAPTGGIILVAGWIGLAAAAVVALVRS